MMFRRFGWVCLGLLCVTRSIPCGAADAATAAPANASATPSNESSADRYFFEAKAKAAEKKWVEALALFERAWELKPSHDIAGNLGQVALKLGRYKKAATFLERCLRLFPPTGNAEQRIQIQALFESARLHVAVARLHADAQPGELVLDRVVVLGPVGAQAEPVFVDPGTHVVQIRRDGKIVGERSFVAVANATHDVNIGLGPSSTQVAERNPNALPAVGHPAAAERPPDDEKSGRSVVPIVIGASVSVAGFVSSALLLSAAHSEASKANGLMRQIPKGCPSTVNDAECTALHEANARADTRYNWGYAMLGVGAAALLTTAGYVLWPRATSDRSSARQSRGSFGFEYVPGRGSLTWLTRF